MRKLFSAILLLLIWPSYVLAQTPQRGGDVRLRNERGQVEAVRLYEGSYALVIGAVNYRHWEKLSGVRDDVPAVRAVLERHGFKVEELLDPMGDNLLPRINRFINEYGLHPNNRLVIYFTGHGYTEVADDGRKFGYIVPVDAPKPAKDPIGFQQKAITMDELETAAKRVRSKHALFVFDSCFSGTLVNKGGVKVPPVTDYYAARPVRQFITAGADNQEVPEESIFRRVFVRGLEGKADTNKDGYITGTELAIYLQEQVLYYRGTSQTPQYGKIRDPRLDSGDFIFTLPESSLETGKSALAHALASQAMDKIMRDDFDEALRLANQSLGLDNSVALAYAVRGRSLERLGQDEAGIRDLQTANHLDERNGIFRALLSVLYANVVSSPAVKPGEAKTTAEEAIQLLGSVSTDTEFYARGISYSVLRNHDRAIDDFSRAIQLNPQFVAAYYNRCNAYMERGDYDRAITDCDSAIRLNPKDTRAYYRRGNAYSSKDNNERAIVDYSEAIQLKPDFARAYFHRALAYEKIGDSAKAQADRDKVAELEKQRVKH